MSEIKSVLNVTFKSLLIIILVVKSLIYSKIFLYNTFFFTSSVGG